MIHNYRMNPEKLSFKRITSYYREELQDNQHTVLKLKLAYSIKIERCLLRFNSYKLLLIKEEIS